MSDSNSITLGNLMVVHPEGGTVKTTNPSVERPSPCVQQNAKGSLRTSSSLSAWRESAWEAGVRFRMALNEAEPD